MIRFFIKYLTVFFSILSAQAQDLSVLYKSKDTAIVRLLKQLETEKQDTSKIKIYIDLSNLIYFNNRELAFQLNKKAQAICNSNLQKTLTEKEEKFFQFNKGLALGNIGTYFSYKSLYDSAMIYALTTLDIYKKLNDESRQADCFNNMAAIFHKKENTSKAIEYYFKSIKINEKLGYRKAAGMGYSNVGLVFYNIGDNEKALYYVKKGLARSIEFKDDYSTSIDYSSLGLIYMNQEKYDSAIAYNMKALEIATKIESKSIEASILSNLGSCYNHKKNHSLATQYYLRSANISEEINYDDCTALTYSKLGEMYYEQKDYTNSILYAKKALTISKKIEDIYTSKVAMRALYKSYKTLNKSDLALEMHEGYIQLRDSIEDFDKKEEIRKQEFKYQSEKKDQELLLQAKDIELLEKDKKTKNYLLIGLGIVFIMAIGIGILGYRNYKQKQKEAELKNIALEQKLLRLQMNPHFIFNSLSSISGQMLHNLNAARDYLAKFARLMRLVLENSREAYVTMKSEVDALNYYMILEQQRFKEKFDFKIDIDSQISIDETEIPPMLIQPHIENAILHGIVPKHEKGLIQVRFIKQTDTSIRCEIEDNGIGRKQSQKRKEENNYTTHKSLALEITKERLDTLSNETNQTLSFNIEDKEDENGSPAGTKVVIVLPCKTV